MSDLNKEALSTPGELLRGPDRWGSKYWGAQLADGTMVYYMADGCSVESGALCFWGAFRRRPEDAPLERILLATYAPGHWKRAWAANVFDGGSVAMEHLESPPPALRKKAGRKA